MKLFLQNTFLTMNFQVIMVVGSGLREPELMQHRISEYLIRKFNAKDLILTGNTFGSGCLSTEVLTTLIQWLITKWQENAVWMLTSQQSAYRQKIPDWSSL